MEQIYRDRYRAEKYGYGCIQQDKTLEIYADSHLIGELHYDTDANGEYGFVKDRNTVLWLSRAAFFRRLIRMTRLS